MKLSDSYINELNRLTLCDDFKEDLKKACKERIESNSTPPAASDSNSLEVYRKIRLYKRIAIAACIVTVISVVGGSSIIGGVFTSSFDTTNDGVASQDIVYEFDEEVAEEESMLYSDELPQDNADLSDYDFIETEDAIIADDTSDDEEGYYDFEYESDEDPDDLAVSEPVIATSLSRVVPDDYTGDYYTEDYVLGSGSASVASNTATVYSSFSELASALGESYSSGYSTALNFYDVLYNQLSDESETIGVSLVWITITDTPNGNGVPSPDSNGYTLYEANISYDYLNAVSCDIDVYVWIKGTKNYQVDGMPSYKEGDDLIVSLMLGDNGCITVVDELIYDAYTINGSDIAYHRVYSNVNAGSTDMGVLDSEAEHITTTSNNPAQYVHKTSARELTRYIRRKVTGENYRIADLEKISLYSMGYADYLIFAEQGNATALDDDSDEQTEFDSEKKTSLSLNASFSSTYASVTAAGIEIDLSDISGAALLGDLYRSSMTGSSETEEGFISALYVGGKITFAGEEVFEGSISQIEITSSGCPLNIRFRDIAVGDSLETVVENLSTSSTSLADQNLADDCTITIQTNFGTAVITVESGTVSKLVLTVE